MFFSIALVHQSCCNYILQGSEKPCVRRYKKDGDSIENIHLKNCLTRYIMAFSRETAKIREELRDIQREIDNLQDDLGDLREKFEEVEEEEYETWLKEGGKQPQPLAEVEMGKPTVKKQLDCKNNKFPNLSQEVEMLNVNDEIDSKKERQGSNGVGVLYTKIEKEELLGNEVDNADFAKRIQRPTNLGFMPSFFEGQERAKTLSLLNPGALSTTVTPCIHRRPIVTLSPVGTVPRSASEFLMFVSTKPGVVESGGGDVNLDVWK